MRIILANSERGWRGGELQTLELAKGMQRGGCDVMIASRARSALSERASGLIPFIEFRFEAIPFATPVALARLVSRWRPDVLHAQTSDAHTHLWLARKLVAGAPPLVVSRRVAFQIGKNPFSLLKYRTGVARYIPISRAASASLAALGVDASRLTVIPSGIDVEAFMGRMGSPEIGRRWGLREGETVFGTVGSFEVEKGHETLLRAAGEVARGNPGIRFILVGEGSLRSRIEEKIRRAGLERVVTIAAPDAPLEDMLPLFDVFVLPSIEEGLSTALIAAMAAGLPVVASRTGGIPDVVSPESGILVPPGDGEALSRAIVALLESEDLRAKMGEAGARRAADFAIGRTVERTRAVYESLLHKEGKRGSTRESA